MDSYFYIWNNDTCNTIILGVRMLITALKIKSRFVFITIISLFMALTVSWAFASNFVDIMTMDYNAKDLVGTKSEIRSNFLMSIATWERFVDSSMFYLINFLPAFFVLVTLGLYAEKRSTYAMGRHRYSSFKKTIYRDVIQYVLLSTATVTGVFIIYYSIGAVFVYRGLNDIGGFASALPVNFYADHPYLFFLFMASTIYLSLAFVFSLLSAALVLIFDREYKVILAVLAIYFVYGKIGFLTGSSWLTIFSSFVAYNTTRSTVETFYPLLGLLIIAIGLLVYGVNKTVRQYEE